MTSGMAGAGGMEASAHIASGMTSSGSVALWTHREEMA
jgi:hypothetical protein